MEIRAGQLIFPNRHGGGPEIRTDVHNFQQPVAQAVTMLQGLDAGDRHVGWGRRRSGFHQEQVLDRALIVVIPVARPVAHTKPPCHGDHVVVDHRVEPSRRLASPRWGSSDCEKPNRIELRRRGGGRDEGGPTVHEAYFEDAPGPHLEGSQAWRHQSSLRMTIRMVPFE